MALLAGAPPTLMPNVVTSRTCATAVLPFASHCASIKSYRAHLTTSRNLSLISPRTPPFQRLASRSERSRAGFVTRASADSSAERNSESSRTVREGEEQAAGEEAEEEEEEDEEVELEKCHFGGKELERFVKINEGQWRGAFLHYDLNGRLLHRVPTRLSATASGRGENSSLLQTLSVKQACTSGEEVGGEEWVEIKLEEVNRITAANRLQVAWFPDYRAYALSHQTAEDLVRALAVGVVGAEAADAYEAAEVIRGVKLPSRRPALVSETCLFLSEPVSEAGSEPGSEPPAEASSEEDVTWGNRRVRTFHVLDSKGMIDTLGVFVEEREGAGEDGSGATTAHARELLEAQPDPTNAPIPHSRLSLLLGEWDGTSTTHRSAIYGETVTHSTSNFFLTRFSDSSLGLEETRGDLCFRRRGAVSNHTEAAPKAEATSTEAAASEDQAGQEQRDGGGRVVLDGGQQITLLPGGLALSAPCCVPRGRAFFFETILAEPEEGEGAGAGVERQGGEGVGVGLAGAEGWWRRRVVRTYDPDGLVVSSSVFAERKLG